MKEEIFENRDFPDPKPELTHCPRGLALYWGAMCDVKAINTHLFHGIEDGIWSIDGHAIARMEDENVILTTLHLRRRMTEEEETEIRRMETPTATQVRLKFGYCTDRVAAKMREFGIDRGGPALKDGEEIWVESFIGAGLAVEKGAEG